MNTPNKLTLARIILSPIFMVFFLMDNVYCRALALLIFTVAALTDLWDGYLARKYGIITGFGKFMDPLADKILVSSALISFIALRYVSPLPVVLIVGREFSVTGLRLLTAYKGVVIPPTWTAKVKTFLQMTVVGLVMSYICLMNTLEHFQHPARQYLQFDYQYYFAWLIWITAAVTIWTGIDYVVKYFHLIKSVLR